MEFEDFIGTSEKAILEVGKTCTGIAAVVGALGKSSTKKRKASFTIQAYFLAEWLEVKSIHHKNTFSLLTIRISLCSIEKSIFNHG